MGVGVSQIIGSENIDNDYGVTATETAQLTSARENALIIKESIPYLVSKEGPNAHLFKF